MNYLKAYLTESKSSYSYRIKTSEEVTDDIVELLGCQAEEIIPASAKTGLGIENIFPEHERVENLDGKRSFDTIVCRSFSSLAKIYLRTKNLKKNEGKIILGMISNKHYIYSLV